MSTEFIGPIRPLRMLNTAAINEGTAVHKGARLRPVEERPPQTRTPHAPAVAEASEFEKHYARAFPRFDEACGGKSWLTEADTQSLVSHAAAPALMGQGDDDAALARTLQDYSVSARKHGLELMFKHATLIERTETVGLMGVPRRHETEVPLSNHVHALSQLYRQEYRYDVFQEEYVDEFSDWHEQTGQKGYLDADDIDRLMEDPAIHGDSAMTLATLKEMLRGGVEAGQSLVFMPHSIHRRLADGTQLKANYLFNQRLLLSNTWQKKKAVLARSVRDLFENGIPDWQAVTQSGFSDCYLEACLAACARQHLYGIVDMVAPDGDGRFTVRFPNRYPVTVTSPTDAQLAVYASSGGDGMWATVIDRAWQQLPERSLSVLTGRPVRTLRAPLDADLVRQILRVEALQGGAGVVGMGTGRAFQYHTVLAYEEESDTVTLRNPWDGRPQSGGGLVSQPMSTLVESLAVLEADLL